MVIGVNAVSGVWGIGSGPLLFGGGRVLGNFQKTKFLHSKTPPKAMGENQTKSFPLFRNSVFEF